MSSVDDDIGQIENESERVFGMGVGTFFIFILFLAWMFAWVFSIPCQTTPKLVTRWCSTFIFVLVCILLIFAEKQNRFENMEISEKHYEENMPARIAVGIFMIISCVGSVIVLVFGPGSDSFLKSTQDREASTLWTD
jgi:hypothetical protein